MRTITFYSYKGGVGRSLLVANTAKYLSTLGKRVFALDLDLEAPGLHYKFELGSETPRTEAAPGVVDILAEFLRVGAFPDSLVGFSTTVAVGANAGSIQIMRAGTAPSGDYWRKLSQLSWFDLFYGAEPLGVPFFLELKERIRAEFSPDFLLIDARTGLTEMGGVATTLLPDAVVCISLASPEHLEGVRAMMQGILNTTNQEGTTVELVSVISRLPANRDIAAEDATLASVLSFLNEPIRDSTLHLKIDQVMILHTEPVLDEGEQLLIGSKAGPHELPLLRDYLRLFSKLIPADDIRVHVGQLIKSATARILDDPDGAQSELEALTAYCADPSAYRALIQIYQVRKASFEKIVANASLMWQMSTDRKRPDPLIINVIKSAFSEFKSLEYQRKYAGFAEEILRLIDFSDLRVLLTISDVYAIDRKSRAEKLLSDYLLGQDAPSHAAVVKLLELLRLSPHESEKALTLIEHFKNTISIQEFFVVWSKIIMDKRLPDLASQLLRDPSYRSEFVQREDPALFYQLLKLADEEEIDKFLNDSIEKAIVDEDMRRLKSLAEVLHSEGRLEELEYISRGRLRQEVIEELIEAVKRRRRGPMKSMENSRVGWVRADRW